MSRNRWGNSSVRIPSGFSKIWSPSTKSFRFGTCAKTLLPAMRSAERPCVASSLANCAPKNRHVSFDKVLQQVTVVAGHLNYKALPIQAESLQHFVAVILAVL